MINVSDDVKKIYSSDVLPGIITLVIDGREWPATGWLSGSLSIFEALCSRDVLSYSAVEASTLEVELASEGGNAGMAGLVGKEIVALQEVGSAAFPSDSLKPGTSLYPAGAEIPLGTFTISETSFDGDYYCKIKAYDPMKKFIDTDITDWWTNAVEFPVTIHDLLIGLCNYCGVKYALPDTWTNSTVFVEKNAVMDSFKASELLGMIQEACGLFFHTDRYGRLKVVTHDAAVTEIPYTALYEDAEIADYEAPAIQGVQIKSSDDDIGILYGQNKNVYQISNNFLLYNKKDSEYQAIAKSILANIGGHGYHPFSAKVKARNYVEIGDPVKITSYKGNTSQFWLLSRKMCDDGLITDEIDVKGKASTVNNTVSSKKTTQVLNRRMHELVNTLDEFRSTISDVQTKQSGNVTGVDFYYMYAAEKPVEGDSGWTATPSGICPVNMHVWQKKITHYLDKADNVTITDLTQNAADKAVPEYCLSTSDKQVAGDKAIWSEARPTEAGSKYYLWTRIRTEYRDGTVSYSSPTCDSRFHDLYSISEEHQTEIDQAKDQINLKADTKYIESRFNAISGLLPADDLYPDDKLYPDQGYDYAVESDISAAISIQSDQIKSTVQASQQDMQRYVDEHDQELKKTITDQYSTQLRQTQNDLTLSIDSVHSETQKNAEDLKEYKDTNSTFFRFSDNGMDIGKQQNGVAVPHSLNVTNEKISFNENGNAIAYIQYNKMHIMAIEALNKLSVGAAENGGYFDFISTRYGMGIKWRAQASASTTSSAKKMMMARKLEYKPIRSDDGAISFGGNE